MVVVSLRSGASLLVCLDSAAGRRARGTRILEAAASFVWGKTAGRGTADEVCLCSGDGLGAGEVVVFCWSAATGLYPAPRTVTVFSFFASCGFVAAMRMAFDLAARVAGRSATVVAGTVLRALGCAAERVLVGCLVVPGPEKPKLVFVYMSEQWAKTVENDM